MSNELAILREPEAMKRMGLTMQNQLSLQFDSQDKDIPASDIFCAMVVFPKAKTKGITYAKTIAHTLTPKCCPRPTMGKTEWHPVLLEEHRDSEGTLVGYGYICNYCWMHTGAWRTPIIAMRRWKRMLIVRERIKKAQDEEQKRRYRATFGRELK